MSAINSKSEPWNGHSFSEVETYIKGELVQSDWEQDDDTKPDYIKNKPDVDVEDAHLTKFDTEAEYASATLDLPNASIVGGGMKYKGRQIDLFDYLHADGTVDKVAKSDVIGLCVIPSSHYGKARFMSVVKMSASSTQGTTESETIAFGPVSDTYRPKETMSWVGMDLLQGNMQNKMYYGTDSNYPYLPTDRIHGAYEDGIVEVLTIPSDWDQSAIYWCNDDDGADRYVPSPFLADGSLNPEYARQWPNVFADMDGEANTAAWLAKSMTDYPAALACHNFAPGFGKWYLPSVGELAYLVPRWGAINDKLQALSQAGCRVALLGAEDYFWSSTAYDSATCWYVDMGSGGVNFNIKNYTSNVVAFSAFQF